MTMRKRQKKGFSLIELLIVVAIILIIAAIAIPNLIRARIAANQSSAAASLRTLASSEAMYQSTYQNGYSPTFGALASPTSGAVSCQNAGLIDTTLAGGSKSGYSFAWATGTTAVTVAGSGCTTAGWADGFAFQASPISTNTGTQYYCVDATNVIVSSSTALTPTGAGGCGGGTAIGN